MRADPGALSGAKPSESLARAALRLSRFLDRAYVAGGVLAAFCMAAILVLTVAQVAARLTGFVGLRGASDYAGYAMAGSSFLAFAYALREGSHVRIELFLSALGRRRVWGERFAAATSALIAFWFAYHSWLLVYWSYRLGDVSQGLDATPLWLPQIVMAVGVSLFAVALAHHLIRLATMGMEAVADQSAAERRAE